MIDMSAIHARAQVCSQTQGAYDAVPFPSNPYQFHLIQTHIVSAPEAGQLGGRVGFCWYLLKLS